MCSAGTFCLLHQEEPLLSESQVIDNSAPLQPIHVRVSFHGIGHTKALGHQHMGGFALIC